MFKRRNSGQSNQYNYRNIHDFTSSNGCNYTSKNLKKQEDLQQKVYTLMFSLGFLTASLTCSIQTYKTFGHTSFKVRMKAVHIGYTMNINNISKRGTITV